MPCAENEIVEHFYVTIIRPHRMHEMLTIANGDPVACASVSQSVCLSRGLWWRRCANMAERIEVLFGVEIECYGPKTGVPIFSAYSMRPSPRPSA